MANFLKEQVKKIDDAFQTSFLGKYFKLEERRSTLSIEFQGALATFLSMAYILAVNPRIISDSGGPCEGNPFDPATADAYKQCVEDLKRELITSTALSSMFGCLLMGILANLPVALAPGMVRMSIACAAVSLLPCFRAHIPNACSSWKQGYQRLLHL